VLVSLVSLASFAAASPAQAHDALVSTSPADGSVVATTPDEVVLTFNEPAMALGSEMVVTGPDGDVQQGRVRLVDSTVRQAISPGPAGRYTVTWRVTSADGHPVSGRFRFTTRTAGTPASDPSTSSPTAPTTPSSSPADGPTPTTGVAVPGATAGGPTSSTSTGASAQSGTSWALWLVGAALVLAGAGATAVRLRRRRAAGDDG
jgi:methionine-rich copper-binding protein CopC